MPAEKLVRQMNGFSQDQQFTFVNTTLPICSARIWRSGPQARDLTIPREPPEAVWSSRGPYRELLEYATTA